MTLENTSHIILEKLYGFEKFRNLRNSRAELLYGLIKPQLEEGKSVLEIGTGKGDLFNTMSTDHPGQVIGLDIEDQRIFPDSNQSFVLADGASLPFADQAIETSIICFVLHHIPEPLITQVVSESLRVSNHVVILEDYIGKELKTPTDILYSGYIKTCDAFLNIGVPGGAMRNQQTTNDWDTIINSCGGQIKSTTVFPSSALGVIPLQHVIFDVHKK